MLSVAGSPPLVKIVLSVKDLAAFWARGQGAVEIPNQTREAAVMRLIVIFPPNPTAPSAGESPGVFAQKAAKEEKPEAQENPPRFTLRRAGGLDCCVTHFPPHNL